MTTIIKLAGSSTDGFGDIAATLLLSEKTPAPTQFLIRFVLEDDIDDPLEDVEGPLNRSDFSVKALDMFTTDLRWTSRLPVQAVDA